MLVGEVVPDAVEMAEVAARATCRARLLAATPSNIKNPQWLADQVVALAKEAGGARAGLRVNVRDERWIERTGMGGLAAVGRGSATPPRLVVLEYRPKGVTAGPVLLVGKGITYDTGGLSIKPREAMVPMKTDMSGAAIVLAATLAAAELRLPQAVVAVLPLAENAVSGSAYRPGDVVRVYDGTTVEIGNTDAEGRMVLADAMAWGRERFAPSAMIDVATLTGAASLGLGKRHAALYATTPELTDGLVAAGEAAGSRSGRCRWSRSTARRSTPRSPTSATSRPTATSAPGRSPRRCSCSGSPATCRGPTSTSPAPAAPMPTATRSPRAPRASRRARSWRLTALA